MNGEANFEASFMPGEADGTLLPFIDEDSESNVFSLMTEGNITFGRAQNNACGYFYSDDTIKVEKQWNIAGRIMANYFDMGKNVPAIVGIPDIENFVPVGAIKTGQMMRRSMHLSAYQAIGQSDQVPN